MKEYYMHKDHLGSVMAFQIETVTSLKEHTTTHGVKSLTLHGQQKKELTWHLEDLQVTKNFQTLV